MILIIDLGSQTTHLVSRRLRDLGIKNQVIDPDQFLKTFNKTATKGIILSGGTAGIDEQGSAKVSKEIFTHNLPILGICYGWQLMAKLLGAQVVATQKEYGPADLVFDKTSRLFSGIQKDKIVVWMSRGNDVTKLPQGFKSIGQAPDIKDLAVADESRNLFGLQFHPEAVQTDYGDEIFKNFAKKICGLSTTESQLSADKLIETTRAEINAIDAEGMAIMAVSGGVDSTVAGVIAGKAIGKRLVPVFCDNGLMRVGAREEVIEIFQTQLGIEPIIVDCKKEFLLALKGITDPEVKRKTIGRLYVQYFDEVASKIKNAKFLIQGTIYSDVIESKGSKHAGKVKAHHNVGGLPEKMKLSLIEPLRELYKDEVRMVGKQLGIPDKAIFKQPFPGPGQAIRIIGEVTPERLEKQQKADQIVLEVLQQTGWYDKVFQSFPIMTGIKTTAVRGEQRVYAELVGLRVYDGQDVMTASRTYLPSEVLQEISSRIVSEVPDVSRVVYDITTKPPATMEWE